MATTFRELEQEETNKQFSQGFIPVPGNKARRYYNPSTGQEISVRMYQRLQHGGDLTNWQNISRDQIQSYNLARSVSRDIQAQQRFFHVVEAGNRGASISEALKAGKMTRKHFEQLRTERDYYGGYKSDEAGNPVGIFSTYEARFMVPLFNEQGAGIEAYASFDQKNASIMGHYWYAVRQAFYPEPGQDPDLRWLENMGNNLVVTTGGQVIVLPTDYDTIALYLQSLPKAVLDSLDEKIYELVKGESIRR